MVHNLSALGKLARLTTVQRTRRGNWRRSRGTNRRLRSDHGIGLSEQVRRNLFGRNSTLDGRQRIMQLKIMTKHGKFQPDRSCSVKTSRRMTGYAWQELFESAGGSAGFWLAKQRSRGAIRTAKATYNVKMKPMAIIQSQQQQGNEYSLA